MIMAPLMQVLESVLGGESTDDDELHERKVRPRSPSDTRSFSPAGGEAEGLDFVASGPYDDEWLQEMCIRVASASEVWSRASES